MPTALDSNNDGVTTEHADRSHDQMIYELNAYADKTRDDVD